MSDLMPALDAITEKVGQWVIAKGWDDNRTFGDEIALLHSECSEALEAYRKWGCEDVSIVGEKPEGVGSEFADIFIRLVDSCRRHNVDLGYEVIRKMDYNWTRAIRHGGDLIG